MLPSMLNFKSNIFLCIASEKLANHRVRMLIIYSIIIVDNSSAKKLEPD